VRPLVELVGKEDREEQEQREDTEQIAVERSLQRHETPYAEHEGKAGQVVVAVGIDEVVADDPVRVYVVLPEGFNEVGPEDRRVIRTEVVGEEVHEPGEEVSDQVSQEGQDRHELQLAEAEHPLVDIHTY
jgi:hypothetical protein